VRSDKKDEARISITARLCADLLEAAGVNRILTMNLHAPQIQGFFRVPLDQMMATKIICEYFEKKGLQDAVVVAPDAGSAKRASMYADHLNLPIAFLDKRRTDHSEKPKINAIIGDVKGRSALVFDDEVSTGGSMLEVVNVLKEGGAKDIHACCVHPVLVGPAVERMNNPAIKEFVTTNTIPLGNKKLKNLRVLSVANLFAEAIRCIHYGESLSKLFRQYDKEFK
jgi:ribose-phosphate pyrophosphokinase